MGCTKPRSPGIGTILHWQPPDVHIFGTNPSLLLISCYVNPHRNSYPVGGITAAGKQLNISGVFQLVIFGSQTQQQMRTNTRPAQSQSIPQGSKIQDGNTENHQNIPPTGGVGDLNKLQGCLRPHSNTGTIQEISEISHPGSDIPIQSTAIWFVHSTHGVCCNRKGGKNYGHPQGYKDSPVPKRLLGERQIPPSLSQAYPGPGTNVPATWLGSKFRKIRTGTQKDFQLCRLPV